MEENHGGESWRRNHGRGIMGEESWRRSHGRGVIEESWKRNHRGVMEKEARRGIGGRGLPTEKGPDWKEGEGIMKGIMKGNIMKGRLCRWGGDGRTEGNRGKGHRDGEGSTGIACGLGSGRLRRLPIRPCNLSCLRLRGVRKFPDYGRLAPQINLNQYNMGRRVLTGECRISLHKLRPPRAVASGKI